MPGTILLVEDDPSIARGLSMNLGLEGFRAVAAADGEEALRLAQSQRPDLIVLDLMLPRVDGLEVIRRLRGQNEDVPIVVLSAKGDEADKVLALSLGADDYVTKPFGLAELIARIRAALRRRRRDRAAQPETRFGHVRIDHDGRRILVAEEEVESTAKEFDLLCCFVQHPGVVFTREQLMQRVWGPDHFGTVRTVDNFVARLRSKIERDPEQPQHIETVRGIGYRFNP
jgi:DNA-binding response OmpR family regulator